MQTDDDLIDQDDRDIVDRIGAGDVDAFEGIMRRYNQRMFRTARAIVKDDDEAQDVVQQAYVQAFHNLDRFEGRARFSTWLTRIVVHEAYRRARQDQRRTGSLVDGQVQQGDADPEQIATAREMARVVEAAIDELSDELRAVFMLRIIEGLDVATTAQCLDIPEATVNTRLHRARHQLKSELEAATDRARLVHRFLGERCNRMVAKVRGRLRG